MLRHQGETFRCPIPKCKRHRLPYVVRRALDTHLHKVHKYTDKMVQDFWGEVGVMRRATTPVAGPSKPQSTPAAYGVHRDSSIVIPSTSSPPDFGSPVVTGWDPTNPEASSHPLSLPYPAFEDHQSYQHVQTNKPLHKSAPSPLRQSFPPVELPSWQHGGGWPQNAQQPFEQHAPVPISQHLRRFPTQLQGYSTTTFHGTQDNQHNSIPNPEAQRFPNVPNEFYGGATHVTPPRMEQQPVESPIVESLRYDGGKQHSVPKSKARRQNPYPPRSPVSFDIQTPESYKQRHAVSRQTSNAPSIASPLSRPMILKNETLKENRSGPTPIPLSHDAQQLAMSQATEAHRRRTDLSSVIAYLDPTVRQWNNDISGTIEAMKLNDYRQAFVCSGNALKGLHELGKRIELPKNEKYLRNYLEKRAKAYDFQVDRWFGETLGQ